VVTLVEQELNTNTAPLAAHFTDACSHYGAILESLDATLAREIAEKARAESALSKKAANAVGRDGPNRLERCEVFSKWRDRFGIAGFCPVSLGSSIAEELVGARVGHVGYVWFPGPVHGQAHLNQQRHVWFPGPAWGPG
jgi:hypothetical protein